MDQTERLSNQKTPPNFEGRIFSGLSLKADSANQPAGVWQELNNFDLYVPGSIRKVLPYLKFNQGNFEGTNILQFCSYWAEPNLTNGPTLRVLGMGQNGKIYDLVTGIVWANLQGRFGDNLATIPFMEVLPIYFVPYNAVSWTKNTARLINDFVLKYDATNGNLYVFAVSVNGTTGSQEPIWTSDTPVTDGSVTWVAQGQPNTNRFQENALIITVPGRGVYFAVQFRYNLTDLTSNVFVQQVGIANPQVPIQVGGQKITPNLNGYLPSAGRFFTYTFYDANTLHESSPAPFVSKTNINEVDQSDALVTLGGSLLQPIVIPITSTATESYQSYYLSVPASIVQAALTQGYESMYFYATHDGGSTFARIPQLYDNNENLISNSDGSVSIAILLSLSTSQSFEDYTPLPTPQNIAPSVRVYEGGGPINLVPDPENFGAASWKAQTGADMVIVPGGSPDGNAAIEQIGTGAVQGTNQFDSVTVPAPTASYYFQAYLDATAVQSGTVQWRVMSGDRTAIYLTLTQVSGVAGILSGTFNKPNNGKNNFIIEARSAGATIIAGSPAIWSEPELFEGITVAPTVSPFYPTPDDGLIVPAPDTLSQGPAPAIALTLVVYQGALFVLEYGTSRAWYSNVGDFQSFGFDSFIVPESSTAGEPVLEIAKAYDRVAIGKFTNISQIQGTDQTNFAPAPIDPQHGIMAARSSIAVGSALISFLNIGITFIGLGLAIPKPDTVEIGFKPEDIKGDIIKPYTDNINPNTLRSTSLFEPCPAIDNTRNLYLYANQQVAGNANFSDSILVGTLTHKGPSIWSNLVSLPALAITIREVQLLSPTNGQLINGVLMSASDGNIYLMFGGTEDGVSVTAQAVTWALPDLTQLPVEDRDTVKTFHELWIEGEQLQSFKVEWSVDGGNTWKSNVAQPYAQPIPGGTGARVRIGDSGRQIQFRFTSGGAGTPVPTATPLLSYFKGYYDISAQASGGNY
jgi:hypothetical protein